MSTKPVSRYKKLLTTQLENLRAVSHFTQHKTFSALNYAQDFGKQSEGVAEKNYEFEVGYTPEKSNCPTTPTSNTFMSLLALSTMSLPSVQTMTKEDEVRDRG